MAISYTTATDISNAALEWYLKGPTFKQTIQARPLLRAMTASQKSFSSGKQYINSPVQGNFMNAESGFFAGWTGADQVSFHQADDIDRCEYEYKHVHAGLKITWTELMQDGITVTQGGGTSQHSDVDRTRLTGILENRLEDFAESWARKFNDMLWADGTQDSKQPDGIQALFPTDNTTGSIGGISRATEVWWRHRVLTGLTASKTDQTLTQTLRREHRQLKRYGGMPRLCLAGSDFIDALEQEVHEKGAYTDAGFMKRGATDIGMPDIVMRGVGAFEYDPSLDDLGYSKRCYMIDTRKTRMRVMEGEDKRTISPERPYDQFIFLRSVIWTGAIECIQMNANGLYELA